MSHLTTVIDALERDPSVNPVLSMDEHELFEDVCTVYKLLASVTYPPKQTQASDALQGTGVESGTKSAQSQAAVKVALLLSKKIAATASVSELNNILNCFLVAPPELDVVAQSALGQLTGANHDAVINHDVPVIVQEVKNLVMREKLLRQREIKTRTLVKAIIGVTVLGLIIFPSILITIPLAYSYYKNKMKKISEVEEVGIAKDGLEKLEKLKKATQKISLPKPAGLRLKEKQVAAPDTSRAIKAASKNMFLILGSQEAIAKKVKRVEFAQGFAEIEKIKNEADKLRTAITERLAASSFSKSFITGDDIRNVKKFDWLKPGVAAISERAKALQAYSKEGEEFVRFRELTDKLCLEITELENYFNQQDVNEYISASRPAVIPVSKESTMFAKIMRKVARM